MKTEWATVYMLRMDNRLTATMVQKHCGCWYLQLDTNRDYLSSFATADDAKRYAQKWLEDNDYAVRDDGDPKKMCAGERVVDEDVWLGESPEGLSIHQSAETFMRNEKNGRLLCRYPGIGWLVGILEPEEIIAAGLGLSSFFEDWNSPGMEVYNDL